MLGAEGGRVLEGAEGGEGRAVGIRLGAAESATSTVQSTGATMATEFTHHTRAIGQLLSNEFSLRIIRRICITSMAQAASSSMTTASAAPD